MTLRGLYHQSIRKNTTIPPLYQQLCIVIPEYGSPRRIKVKLMGGEVVVTNVHVGFLGDIVTYNIDVDPALNITKTQLLDAILKEMVSGGMSEGEQTDFWSDFDNLQKAKIIR